MPSDTILVGKFGAPHGVRGEVRLKSYTGAPLDVARYRPLADKTGRPYALKSARLVKDDMLVVRVEGIDTRDAAATLTNVDLYILRSDLPAPDPDEFYHADLVGLAARRADGTPLGTVAALQNFGGGTILEVAPVGGGETLLFPFTAAVVPTIDIAGGFVEIVPPTEIDGDDPEG
jgi:16S rRNA processing protein RimM